MSLIPSGFQNFAEWVFESLYDFLSGLMGAHLTKRVFWFFGSWLLGALYDWSVPAMIAVSVGAQVAAIPLYYLSSRANRSSAQPPSQNDGITRA